MRYDELDSDEKLIINHYRELKKSEKQAVLASESSFQEWIKKSVRWVWDRIVEYAMQEALTALFNCLKQQFFGY